MLISRVRADRPEIKKADQVADQPNGKGTRGDRVLSMMMIMVDRLVAA
jgi:hypothetical protein